MVHFILSGDADVSIMGSKSLFVVRIAEVKEVMECSKKGRRRQRLKKGNIIDEK